MILDGFLLSKNAQQISRIVRDGENVMREKQTTAMGDYGWFCWWLGIGLEPETRILEGKKDDAPLEEAFLVRTTSTPKNYTGIPLWSMMLYLLLLAHTILLLQLPIFALYFNV